MSVVAWIILGVIVVFGVGSLIAVWLVGRSLEASE